MEINRAQLIILTAVVTIIVTVMALHIQGYIRHSSTEDGIIYGGFSVVLNVPDMEQYVSSKPAKQQAICAQGFLMLESVEGPQKMGMLVDDKRRAIRCDY